MRSSRGHLVLLLIAFLLIAGAQIRPSGPGSQTTDFAELSPSVEVQTDAGITVHEISEVGTEAVATPEFHIEDIPVPADTALQPQLNPVTYRPQRPRHELITYTVQAGDTAVGIAAEFGIREETILGGNSFLQNDAAQLWAGTEIVILPVDGVLHDVVEGDTLQGLAEKYGVEAEAIIAYEPNNLSFPFRLVAGTQILVPGAVAQVWVWDPPSYAPGGSSPEALQGVYVAVPGTGVFVRPWVGGSITQNPWYGHMAVDIGLVTGSPVYASDTGTVTYAAWSQYGYGNLVVINHGNGFETFYAHLNGFNVRPGQTVYQGNLIAWSGNTGMSSGPHLHFEIRFQKQRENPWTYIQ